MTGADEWEGDPKVRVMRRIFARMEETQRALLSALGIAQKDPRLRGWREKALPRVERCWRAAAARGLKITEQKAAVLYTHCLAEQISRDGIRIDSNLLPSDQEIDRLLKETA